MALRPRLSRLSSEDEFDERYDIRGGFDLPAPADVPGREQEPAAGLQAGLQLGAIKSPMVPTGSGSLNDNVPAHTGVPTYQFTLASGAAGAGGHAFWEWGTRGAPATEVARMHRVLTAALIVSGFHAADGTVVPPSVGPIGQRTREVVR